MYRRMFLVILFFISCLIANATMHTGVLRINLNNFGSKSNLRIYNRDGSVYVTVFKEDGEVKILDDTKKINNSILKDIRAYYLDYGLMIFDVDPVQGNQYPVYIGNQLKFIKTNDITIFGSYQSWNKFIASVFIKINNASSLLSDTTHKKIIPEAEKYSYSIKKISGDWAYVECLKTCEECPVGKIIRGWIRWRDNNKLLIDLFYFC